MATRKIDFINGAYSQLRISGLTVNPTPEDVVVALNRLEDMAEEFQADEIFTGYNFEDSPNPNSLTNVPRKYNQLFQTNLAVRLIPDFNKEVPQVLLLQASQSLSSATGDSMKSRMNNVNRPDRMPIGSGNSQRYRPFRFYKDPADPPAQSYQLYIGDIADFVESYDSWLSAGETLAAYTISVDPGLVLLSDSLASPQVLYRLQGQSQQFSGNWQQVKIKVTSSLGRELTRIINFNVVKPDTVGSIN